MKRVVSPGVDRTGEISTNTEAASSSSGQPCRFNNGVMESWQKFYKMIQRKGDYLR